jgi:hypothetical protein
MALNVSTGRVIATLPGGSLPLGATLINVTTATAGINTGATLYSTTAGKFFYLYGIQVNAEAGSGQWNIYYDAINILTGFRAATGSDSVSAGTIPIAQVPDSKDIKIDHAFGAGNCTVTLWGYEI